MLLQASVLRLWVEDRAKQAQDVKHRAQAMAAALAAANGRAVGGDFKGPHPSSLSGSLEEGFRGWSQASAA